MRIRLGEHEPEVHESAWIAPNATVIGRVRLAAEVSIWYSAVVRGDMEDISVGAGSNIQDGCVLHADPGFPLTVGTGVSVGHNAILHGCTIGADVLVGMGATVLNGAVIGAGSLIAANALIPEGAEIPPGSLVAGVPGKVRRELGEAERDRIRLNAAVYRHNTDTHRGATEV
ncbi:carbonic anhydrase/acetyltransferase-like protein (isoleucine patch superfamily) [Nocardia transvalensis]|uniref:Carbonic anhydrase/acetyltransferase-like protein (Isoleucine patch superfamily) n=1 Tax=Nocardia transvalensis TaxID=37333 RepID=A0A7W9UM33_9NOCA|nr:gamma carbonic anhydrase family protein [Nocardia transvalensis]MBB5918199.1 carbonic anhydrase/acetyltransferase-like protein (isoleucine patch superfamily) [Nocardia transvalensis]